MLKSRKRKHVEYILDRMRELYNEINDEVIWNKDIDYETVGKKKNLLFKYRRRVKLLKA